MLLKMRCRACMYDVVWSQHVNYALDHGTKTTPSESLRCLRTRGRPRKASRADPQCFFISVPYGSRQVIWSRICGHLRFGSEFRLTCMHVRLGRLTGDKSDAEPAHRRRQTTGQEDGGVDIVDIDAGHVGPVTESLSDELNELTAHERDVATDFVHK